MGTEPFLMLQSSFSKIRSGNLFEGEMPDIRANACMLNGNGANLPFSVQIDQSVFVQIASFGHFLFAEFNI